MRVKRINRPKNAPNQRTAYNFFNFGDESQNVAGGVSGVTNPANISTASMLPKTLSSLQIFYPQYQPTSQMK